jgi:hypothetical protein
MTTVAVMIAHLGWMPAEELLVSLAATGSGLVVALRAALRRLRQDVRSG